MYSIWHDAASPSWHALQCGVNNIFVNSYLPDIGQNLNPINDELWSPYKYCLICILNMLQCAIVTCHSKLGLGSLYCSAFSCLEVVFSTPSQMLGIWLKTYELVWTDINSEVPKYLLHICSALLWYFLSRNIGSVFIRNIHISTES